MIGLDTNILVRYITQDDEGQAKRVNQAFSEAMEAGETCFLSTPVSCELVWVLESSYRYPREVIVTALRAILETEQFAFDNKDILAQAVSEYALGPGDFMDYVVGRLARAAGSSHTLTFDQDLLDSTLFKVLR